MKSKEKREDIGFALLGCGKVALKYAENLVGGKIPGAHLVAVADSDRKRALEWGNKYQVPHYDSIHNMLESKDSEIDVVAILTPSGLHAQHAVEISKYRKQIIVEKPIAMTLNDADTIVNACDRAGIKLFVVKQNRFNLPVRKLREAVENGRFGKMVMGTARVRWSRDQSYYDSDSWRGTWQYDGGAFANQAIHHIDLLQWMMGEVESVYAKSSTRLVNIEVEDTGVALIKFVSGALGVIEVTTATRPKDLEGSLSILGERGSVELGGFSSNEIKHWNFVDESEEEKCELMEKYGKNPEVYAFAHIEYLNAVVRNIICNKKGFVVDGLAGRKSLEIITAIYESVETNKEVTINFCPKKCRLGLP